MILSDRPSQVVYGIDGSGLVGRHGEAGNSRFRYDYGHELSRRCYEMSLLYLAGQSS